MKRFPRNLTPKMIEGITGFNLCSYLTGLEGWRRGLNLKYYVDISKETDMSTQRLSRFGRAYSLSNGKKRHFFYQSRGDKVSNTSVKLANSKSQTHKILNENNVPMLKSISFKKKDENNKIIKQAEKIGYPVIIKPTFGSLSKGVILNIMNATELENSLKRVRDELGFENIILEKYFDGDDIRVYVVGKKAVASIKRKPATITGNGKDSIQKLIANKNKTRSSNPYLSARPIKINKETKIILSKQNLTINSILEKGKKIRVKRKSTMTQGVDLYDTTDTLPNDIKNIAIEAVSSIPEMNHGSVDLLYNGKEAFVLEVNSSANISLHMFPTEGKPRNVSEYIIDYYFPETVHMKGENQHMYFDYLEVLRYLKKNISNYIEVNPLVEALNYAKKYCIQGDIFTDQYLKLIFNRAVDKRMNGYIKRVKQDKLEILLANKNKIAFKKILTTTAKKFKLNNNIKKIEVYNWDKEVNIGFQIENEY